VNKNLVKILYKILPHLNIVLAGMYLVLFVLDFNHGQMNFVGNLGTKILMAFFALSSIAAAVTLMVIQRRK